MTTNISYKILKAIAVIITVSLIVTTWANEIPIDYEDVPVNSVYYEAVSYFTEKKAISEQRDGLFHPESDMTVQEWTSLLSCVTGKKETSEATNLTASNVYKDIWDIAGIQTYEPSQYGFASNLDAAITAMAVTGLIAKDSIESDSISRGDATRLLYEVAVKKSVTEVPDTLIHLFDIHTDCTNADEAESQLRTLLKAYPNTQLAMLLVHDYDFVILDDLTTITGDRRDGSLLAGLEDDGTHTIYLNRNYIDKAALHEIGHAVETSNCAYSKSWELNKAEGEASVNLLGDYAGTNASEFIAEATSYFVSNQGNEDALSAMKEVMPQTYEYLSQLMNRAPTLWEEQFFAIIF